MRKFPIPLLILFLAGAGICDQHLQERFPVSGAKKLEMDLDTGGRLVVRGWEKPELSVDLEVRGRNNDNVDLLVQRSSDRIRVESRFIRNRYHKGTRLIMTVQVPRHFDLQLDSSGGSMSVSDIRGEIRGRTMGGNLDLSGLEGTLNMKTMGGSITLRDSRVDGRVLTMGGQVVIDNVTGDVDARSLGGKVMYRNVPSGDGGGEKGAPLRITSMGGDINLNNAPSGVYARTLGGNVRIRRAMGFVEATTMGGDILVDAVDGWIKAETMGGDIEVTMTGDPERKRRDVMLKSRSGDIILIAPSGLSMALEIELAYTRGGEGRYQIISDFPLDTRETSNWDDSHGTSRRYIYARGISGKGTNKVIIKTVNGTVTVQKSQ